MHRRLLLSTCALLLLLLSGDGPGGGGAYAYKHHRHYQNRLTRQLNLQITVYPHEVSAREGREATFDCRARTSDQSFFPQTRWTRVGGPLPTSARESGGRLIINPVSLSDAGRYACIAMHNGRSVEAYGTLHVHPYGPQALQQTLPDGPGVCQPGEKLCGTNECVKQEYVCDGEADCRDRSDELNCPTRRLCEPNEFKCDNDRCIQKMWLCDGDDDCGDGSDERNCGTRKPGDLCQPTEFQCADRRQCVPQSFQCDGTNDCHDGSDEVGCVQPTVVQPPESNKVVNQGDTFKLTCRAVAVPDPYINWRLNWGPVCEPPRCVQQSEGGLGTLTVHNAQPLDQGAYTCEAINVKGRVLATPDCIVRIVNIPAPPPPPPPPARQQCRGPETPQGCLRCFCFGITDQCRSSDWYRMKEKLFFHGDDTHGVTLTDIDQRVHPAHLESGTGFLVHNEPHDRQTLYWNLPQRFLGNKVTAYGGNLNIQLQYSCVGSLSREPLIVIKGNGLALQHTPRDQQSVFVPDRAFTVTVPTYESHYTHLSGAPATREDLMMVLADLDTFLIRATHCDQQRSTSLGDVSWEISVDRDTQEGRALEVEHCACPPGYIGTSCEDCAPGYERAGHGPYLGYCVPIRQPQACAVGAVTPQPGTPYDCQPQQQPPAPRAPPCDCNNHSPRGCDSFGRCILCEHNTEGVHCESCKRGYYGDARRGTPYDCTPCPCPGQSECYLDDSGQPHCRNCPAGYYGRLCDECAPGYTRSRTPGGRECEPIGRVGPADIEFVRPEVPLRVEIVPPKHLHINEGSRAKWTCRVVTGPPDVQLEWTKIGENAFQPHVQQLGNQLVIDQVKHSDAGQYRCTGRTGTEIATDEGTLQVVAGEIPQPVVTPPHQVVPENQQAIFTCTVPGFADCEVQWHFQHVDGPLPPGVHRRGNQIVIPQAQRHHAGDYICTVRNQFGRGVSNPGRLEITKTPLRPMVDPPEQTVGVGDPARFRCWVPGVPNAVLKWRPAHGGSLPNGAEDRDGFLNFPRAEQAHQGQYICAAYDPEDDPQGDRPIDSSPVLLNLRQPQALAPQVEPPHQLVDVGQPAQYRCWVPGVPHAVLRWRPESGGQLPQGAEERGGHLIFRSAQLAHEGRYICAAYDPRDDPRGERPVDSSPVQLEVRQPTRAPQAPQVDPPHQTVDLGEPARFRCWVPGDPNAELRWSAYGNRPLPQGAIDRDGILEFPSVEDAHAGGYVCSVIDPASGPPVDSSVVRLDVRKPKQPEVDPPEQIVPEGEPARIRCWVPGEPNPRLTWSRRDGRPLPEGAHDDGRGVLSFPQTKQIHADDYECTFHDPETRKPSVSQPAHLGVEQRVRPQEGVPPRPVATPPRITVKPGETARFHCDANSPTPAEIHWSFGHQNGPLPYDARQEGDDVVIENADEHSVGQYICHATNEYGTGVADPVHLDISEHEIPPTAKVKPKVWQGKPGDKHRFICEVTGVPPPQISWTGPGGGSLPDNVVDLGDGVLEITDAQKEHEGDYTCTAFNIVGTASDFGTVSLSPSLTLITTPAGPRIILTVGEPLEIKCEAFGDPDPEVEWLHDPGPERGDLPDDFKPVTISEQFIRHPGVTLGNAGRYTCKGSNKFATVTKDIYVEVVEPSQAATLAILGGSNQWFRPGQPAQLICTASGSQLVDRLEWAKADGPLPAGVEDHNEPGLLNFDNFRPADEGDYECRAFRNDKLLTSTTVRVYSDTNIPQDAVHVEISGPTVRVVNKGDSIVLDCIVHVPRKRPLCSCNNPYRYAYGLCGLCTRTAGRMPVRYTWVHWTSRLRTGEIAWCPKHMLELSNVQPEHTGFFAVKVHFADGTTTVSKPVTVLVSTTAGPHEAVEDKFEEDSTATIACPVYTVPGATVTWHKQGGDLPENAEQKQNLLIVHNFDDASSGIYTCSVQYGSNTVEGYVHAKIFVPDTTIKVVLNVSSESVKIGDRAWLDCVVIGDPTATIEFSKDGEDALPSNAQVAGNRLLFTSISEDNTGKYRCQATTSEGILETHAVLNVEPTKRKRKHLSARERALRHRQRRLRSHLKRRAPASREGMAIRASRKVQHHNSVFGSWFDTL